MRLGKAFVASALLALALPGMPLAAQSTFSLPPGQATPTARPAGPVDPSDPITSAPRPRPTATPTATAAPTAQPAPAATGTTAARPAAAAQTRPAARATPAAAAARPTAPATVDAAPADGLTLPGVPPTTSAASDPFPTALPTAVTPPPATAPAPAADLAPDVPDWWPWAAGALALLVALGALLRWRRNRSEAPVRIEFEPPVVPAPAPPPAPAPAPASPPVAPQAAQPAPSPAKPQATPPATAGVAAGDGLALALETRRLDASLVATTLAYTLRVTNPGASPLTALAIEGDMIAAHASLPVERQIASPDQRLELRHALVELAPGESVELRGEFRLPLAAITPIRASNATYFVPLVRLRVEATQATGQPLVLAETHVIGELPDQPGGALRPFRLDLGPRTFGRIGQRAVN